MARPAVRKGNLPAEATSFIGRRKELAEIKRKLGAARLVSLVGPGGVGKTRLAIRAATDLNRRFPGGAWLVELGEVQDAALMGNAVMAALDLRDQASTAPHDLLLGYLRDRELLLVLDNCEHLLDEVAQGAAAILEHAPGVRLLVTSREPLSIGGEHVVAVPPLELPAPHATGTSEAVALFVERAEAASGNFELTPLNQAAVADLSRRLDGLPLAIELAAVRTRVLTVEQILDRLRDRFGLLTGGGRAALPRHQTLQTAIDWSYDLLTEPERVMFRRLCVFAGRFTLEDVEAIAETDAFAHLSSLVDKSLVLKEDARGAASYRLHETMREYARQKLEQSGELERIVERSTDYYVTRFRTEALPSRFRMREWLAWTELEIDNVRAILRRCLLTGDSTRGIDLATSLAWFWVNRATTEGVRWLDELLASGPGDPLILTWTYFIRGFIAVLQGDAATARPFLEKAIAVARAEDQPVQLAHSLTMASIAEVIAGNREPAWRFLREAEDVASGIDEVTTRIAVLQARCLNSVFDGDVEMVTEAAAEGVRLTREVGDAYGLHMMLLNLGSAALLSGDALGARANYEEALRLAYEVDDRIGQFYLLGALAYLDATGSARVAAQLLGASYEIRVGAGAKVMSVLAPYLVMAEDVAAESLGRTRFQAEFDAGRRLTREAAVRLALNERRPEGEPVANGAERGQLGKREADVARLVAEGMSNKQIGARLFISERTVDSHVRSILNKLGFNSRAQIAGWVASSSPR